MPPLHDLSAAIRRTLRVATTLALIGCQGTDQRVTSPPAVESAAQSTETSATTPQRRLEAPTASADAWRDALLDTAMRTASTFPEKAHARVKSRLQRDVAETAIATGRTGAAIRYADAITDWRADEVRALAAQALAAAGRRAEAEACLAKAVDGVPRSQDWMRDQLNAEIGVACAALGQIEQARRFAAAAPPELTGKVEARIVEVCPTQDLDQESEAFDRAIATGSLDIVRSGIDGQFAIWARDPRQTAHGRHAEAAIRGGLRGLPVDLQIRTHLRLAEHLARAGRTDDARREMDQAAGMFAATDLDSELSAPLLRDLVDGHSRFGDATAARELVQRALDKYPQLSLRLADIDRADYLRCLAEAQVLLGDRDAALRTWDQALEAGRQNPNARPRAEDLCRTCLSMTRSGVEPTPAMKTTIAQIAGGLKSPW